MQVRAPGVRQDILAVGYGQFEFGPPICGMVALWSLKNPGYPLWSFPTPSGVTAVDFSVYNPNMLAVGLYNGTLAVHDVKTRQVRPCTTIPLLYKITQATRVYSTSIATPRLSAKLARCQLGPQHVSSHSSTFCWL